MKLLDMYGIDMTKYEMVNMSSAARFRKENNPTAEEIDYAKAREYLLNKKMKQILKNQFLELRNFKYHLSSKNSPSSPFTIYQVRHTKHLSSSNQRPPLI